MDTGDSFIFMIGGFLLAIARLLLLGACIILVIKQKNGATMLMLVSQILAFLVIVLSYALPVFAARESVDVLLQITKLMSILKPLPDILFAAGLLWYAVKWVKNKKPLANSK